MQSTDLTVLLYRSKALSSIESGEDLEILGEAIAFNRSNDISGFLIRYEDHFVQVLEGNDETVTELYDRIATDDRHTDTVLVWKGRHSERRFPFWSMSYAALSADPEINEIGKLMEQPIEDKAVVDRCIGTIRDALMAQEKAGILAH